MTVQTSYPGVYIDEVTSAGAISGVGTSTAAFIGPSKKGELNIPVKITSWEIFKLKYGDESEVLDGFYLWYAVRSFFQNGGSVCYVTRVSNGTFSKVELLDRSAGIGQATILVRARLPGVKTILIAIAESHAVDTFLYNPTATIAAAIGKILTIANADAAKFRADDIVEIGNSTPAVIRTIMSINSNTINLDQNTTVNGTNTSLRLASLTSNTDFIRVENGAKLSAGSVVDIVSGTRSVKCIVSRVEEERISATVKTYRVFLTERLGITTSIPIVATITVKSQEFDLTVSGADGTGGPYNKLSMNPGHPNYFSHVINADPNGSIYAYPLDSPNTSNSVERLPKIRSVGDTPLVNPGNVETNNTLNVFDYSKALKKLEPIDDINMVVVPDRTDKEVQNELINHCERMKDRIAILDSRPRIGMFGEGGIIKQREAVPSSKGYAALYYPWIYVSKASGNGQMLIPPSGSIAGVYARTDATRGVHKAPGGTEANIRGAFGVDVLTSDADQSQLNLIGINLIRVFAGNNQPLVWGARTTADPGDWQYISTRRLFLFIEESIQESIRWAVFEPNNLGLWKKLKRVITDFLRQQWRNGALFGATEEQAFYVRIDEDINSETERQLGRLNIEIGIKPSFPAEFIVVRIGIWQGATQILES